MNPIDELFAICPEVRGRLIRAAVVAVRSGGRTLDDVRPMAFSLRGGTIGVLDARGADIVRLPVADLAGRVDA